MQNIMKVIFEFSKSRIRIDRNELSGAFGDIGTVFPLIVGILMVTDMNASAAFIAFGLMQMLTAMIYGIPMPVQPLKAAALIVITQKLSGGVLCGGGLAIGIIMLIFTLAGGIDFLNRLIPKTVIRGIQMGLALQLIMLAIKEYIPSNSINDYVLAGVSFIVMLALIGNRRFPPALILIPAGIIYGILFNYHPGTLNIPSSPALPNFTLPSWHDIITGFLILAIPQVPLSLGNSIFASNQMIKDYFPDKNVPPRKIAFTYSIMNILSPLIGGIPVCHGSGGIAGHYAFGARTGGSVIICGSIMLAVGLIFGTQGGAFIAIFPKPLLGVILLFEALALLRLVADTIYIRNDFKIMMMVGIFAISLPYGYIIGMAAGIFAHYALKWRSAYILMVKDTERCSPAMTKDRSAKITLNP